MQKIEWNKVTWYSKALAVVVFLAVFAWAFYLGFQYGQIREMQNGDFSDLTSTSTTSSTSFATDSITETLINDVTFKCDVGKSIQAQFMKNTVGQGSVALELSDGRVLLLPQAMSADGARYAKPDESFVFWNKGNGAFVEEGAPYDAVSTQKMTFTNCVVE